MQVFATFCFWLAALLFFGQGKHEEAYQLAVLASLGELGSYLRDIHDALKAQGKGTVTVKLNGGK